MKILTTEEQRQADAYTIANEPIASIDLMERAAGKCFDWILAHAEPLHLKKTTGVAVICGKGNNGGDGLAIARMFHKAGFRSTALVVEISEKASDDFLVNLKRAKDQGVTVRKLIKNNTELKIKEDALVIDALFGTGLTRPLSGWIGDLIKQMNELKNPVISIDVPSGMADPKEGEVPGEIVSADVTLTFQSPKLAFLLPESGSFAGNFEVLDIGLSKKFIKELSTSLHFITAADVRLRIKIRDKFSHKGINGHSLLIGGSKGKMGAMVLAAKGCLRSGSGLVTAFIPGVGLSILQTAAPEIMAQVDEEMDFIHEIPELSAYDAIGIGPGLGKEKASMNAVKVLIQNSHLPLVIDADGLNALSENKTWLSFLPMNSILTPHPGEFKRLVGSWKNDHEKIKLVKEFARKYSVYMVLKGAHTVIACPDGQLFFNSSGNPGMATAGSGDVLTGVLSALLAQRYDSKSAAIIGVYVHGLAGDLAATEYGELSMTAADLIDYLPKAFNRVYGPEND